MLKLKGCPRCHGDLIVTTSAVDGRTGDCLQCGFVISLRTRPAAPAHVRALGVSAVNPKISTSSASPR
jgi:hypothetical protein